MDSTDRGNPPRKTLAGCHRFLLYNLSKEPRYNKGMKATITESRRRPFGDRFINRGFNVFVESSASKLIDKWFYDNEIFKLGFKSKAWSKLKRSAIKLEIKAMRELFGDDCDITYSVYAGCSCPCSPGFRVRKCEGKRNVEHFNNDVWMNIKGDVSSIKALFPKCSELLKKEIAEHEEALV